jgi:hypothetical protein
VRRYIAAAEILLSALALAQLSCGGSPGAGQSPAAQPPPVVCSNDMTRTCTSSADCAPDGFCLDARLASDEVRAIMESAGRALDPNQYEIAVAVTDRRGVILGVGTTFPIDYPASCGPAVRPPTAWRDRIHTRSTSPCSWRGRRRSSAPIRRRSPRARCAS